MAGTRDPQGITRHIDSLIRTGIDNQMIPGAIISFVSNDSIYLNRGYGLSDIENMHRTNGSNTLFQLGSIGKTLTVIAVLQQVEAGNLDLHEDVNHYLDDWNIINPFNQSLSLFHLLTHSGGINDRNIGYMANRNENIEPLEKHLERRMPSLFQSPGININYSNYGYGLAGHLVEKVTDMPFTTYIRENILAPLKMDKTTYYLPDDYKDNVDYASGYQLRRSFVEVNNYPKQVIPAGSLMSTALDMSKLLQELLKQELLLSPESYNLMFSTQFTNHPMLPGYTLGFEEQYVNGHYVIAKGGQVNGFLSALVICPDLNFGIFISVNTETDNFSTHFWNSVFNYIYTDIIEMEKSPKVNIEPDKYGGNFKNEKTSHNSVEELFTMLMGKVKIVHDHKNNIRIINSNIKDYEALSKEVFYNIQDPDDLLAFDVDEKRINYMYKGISIGGIKIPASFSVIPWYEDPDLITDIYPFILLTIPLYLVFFLLWLLLKVFSVKSVLIQHKIKIKVWNFHLIAFGFSTLFLVDILFFFIPLINKIRAGELFFGLNDYFIYFRLLHIMLCLFIIALLINAIRLWREKQVWTITKTYYYFFVLSSMSYIFMLFNWHFFWIKY